MIIQTGFTREGKPYNYGEYQCDYESDVEDLPKADECAISSEAFITETCNVYKLSSQNIWVLFRNTRSGGGGGGGGDSIAIDTTLTRAGQAADAKAAGDKITELNDAIDVLEPTATSSDVGKTLKVKTVSGGKVTEYEFGDGGSSDIDVASADEIQEYLGI